jgi:hypothetical protein
MFKKATAVIVSMILLFSLFVPGSAVAADPRISLENSVKIAKSAFDIPESYSKFESNYDEYGDNAQWRLSWRNPDKPEESMEVTVDGMTGEIKYMWKSQPYDPDKPRASLPKYTISEAVKIAEKFLSKVDLNKAKQAVYIEDSYRLRPLAGSYGPVTYYLTFRRNVNGIPFPENNIRISVSGETGEVTNYSMNWDRDVKFPDSGKIIAIYDANKVFKENGVIRLEYIKIQDNKDRDKVPEVKLIYRLAKTNAAVDALTGEFMPHTSSSPYYDEYAGAGMMKMANEQKAMDSGEPRLSVEEQSNVEQIEGLLSKDEAVKKAKSYFDVPSDYKLNGANLNRKWEYPRDYRWSFNWNKEDPKKGFYSDINITIDAKTGDIQSYNYYDSDMYRQRDDKKKLLTKEKAEQLAREITKKYKPEYYAKTELLEQDDSPYYIQEEQKMYNFTFTHKIDDALFPSNNIYVRVNADDGRVISFNCNWTELEMPSAEGIKTLEQAQDSFFDQIGTELVYVREYKPGKSGERPEKPEIRLVYRFKQSPSNMIDAADLVLIDYEGKPVEIKKRVPFTDISGHKFEADIEMLYEFGVVGGSGDKFRPDDITTNAEFLKMLIDSVKQDYYPPIPKLPGIEADKWYALYYNRAVSAGIVDAKQLPDPDGKVTRTSAGRMLIKAIKLGFAAEIQGIYNPQVTDANHIPEDLKGVAALTVGLGIIKPIDGRFDMNAEVTRGEAASFIIGLLKVEK